MESFKEGFSSVVDLLIFKKWIKPQEISLFTQGLLEIKFENLLDVIVYRGGSNALKTFFETYLQ